MRRSIALAMTVAVVCVAYQAAPAVGDVDLSYGCYPPLPPAAANCYAWHTGPVTIHWVVGLNALPTGVGNCFTQTFSQDTAGLPVSCEVQNVNDLSKTQLTAE